MSWFEEFWGITENLKKQLDAHFSLNLESSTHDLANFSSNDGNCNGSLTAYTGNQVERLVHGYIRKSQSPSYSTMRLTTWLKPHIDVPHLAFEFGTRQHFLFYIDYIPRGDLMTDLDYIQKYYEPVNATYLKLRDEPNLTKFISTSPYIRSLQSPISLCYVCAPNVDSLEMIRGVAKEMLERWLKWVDNAQILPEKTQPQLAARDFSIRRSSAELDPGNKFAVQMLGSEMTDKLVRTLWGGA
ncbi:MAG: red chlorophyll catabolite reductase [Calothrix sp. C42_A2020_038]|nr:red chlorophyll catabolite reductase [Calothrix sp. C42_A2020_038]